MAPANQDQPPAPWSARAARPQRGAQARPRGSTLADRWEAEAAEHVRLGAQYRTDRNDRLAAWAMSHADACHWHAATLRSDYDIVTAKLLLDTANYLIGAAGLGPSFRSLVRDLALPTPPPTLNTDTGDRAAERAARRRDNAVTDPAPHSPAPGRSD